MAINFAAASTAGLNNPGTEIVTLVKDGSGNFINPPSYDKMRAYLSSGEVPMLFVTAVGGETGSFYQFSEYSETENKIRFSNDKTTIAFSAGAVAPAVSNVVPKPLTYDYMPEGYPKKSGWSIEWDGNTTGLISFTEAGKTFYKVSDMLPTSDALIGSTMESSDGLSNEVTSKDINAPSEDITIVSKDIWIVRKDITAPDNSLIQKGTYFKLADTYYISRLSKQTVTPMAEEFLPANTKNTTVFYA